MYDCEFCSKSFKQEAAAFKHRCEKKKRWEKRFEKTSQVAYECYRIWFRLNLRTKKEIPFEEFIKSRYYKQFIKLADYCISVHCKDPTDYLEWLSRNEIKGYSWDKDSTYKKYRNELVKKEPAERAAEKFVLAAKKWSEETGYPWTDYWDKAGVNIIYSHILDGKISPWILLTSDKAQKTLDNMPDEMIQQIVSVIDIQFWRRKISVRKKDSKWLEEMFD